jgi:hypothetical protein
MAYNILFTSLFSVGKDEPLRYYYAQEGDKRLIRNETNHVAENVEEADTLFPDEKDVSLKLIHIQESIMYFIQAFDKVTELVRDKDVSPVRITVKDVKAAARRIEKEYRDSRR